MDRPGQAGGRQRHRRTQPPPCPSPGAAPRTMHPALERVVEWFSNVIIHMSDLDRPVLGTEDYRRLTFPLCST